MDYSPLLNFGLNEFNYYLGSLPCFVVSSLPRVSAQVILAENNGGTDLCVSHGLRSLPVLREHNASLALLGFCSTPAEESSLNLRLYPPAN